MSRLAFDANIESGFSQGLFRQPEPKRIKLDTDCEITQIINDTKTILNDSRVGVSKLIEKPLGESIPESFSRSKTVIDLAALTRYQQLIEDTNRTPRKLPKRNNDSLNESSFSNLFGTPLKRKDSSKMGAIFSTRKPKTEFERNLEEIQQFSNALEPVNRNIVNYDDSTVSVGIEASESALDISFLDDKTIPRRSPIKTIEVQPIPVSNEAYRKGLDNTKLRELELRRVELERRRKIEEEERKAKILEVKQRIHDIENKRNEEAVVSATKDQLRLELEGLVLDIPRGKESFKQLPEDAIALIRHAWNRHLPDDEIFVDSGAIKIHRKDLMTLNGLNWLNDEIINFYLDLISKRSKADTSLPMVYPFQTFFYSTLGQRGYGGVRRWTRKVDIFSYDLWLVPVHLQVHWCMAIVDVKNKTIEYYDSMLGKNHEVFELLTSYITSESLDKKKEQLNTNDWKLIRRIDIPTQQNGSDCGMFACKFAEYASRQADIDFTQKHMPYFRQRMVYEICKQHLM